MVDVENRLAALERRVAAVEHGHVEFVNGRDGDHEPHLKAPLVIEP